MTFRYTLVVGSKQLSSWSLRPYLAMRATGAPFQEVVIALNRAQTHSDILRHSPSGKVPALKIEEGGEVVTVFDSLAICETLAERHQEAGLWPDAPFVRARARAYACEMHAGFAALRKALPMQIASRLPTPELGDEVKQDIARVTAAWEEALQSHDKDGGFLFGRFSIADCMYAPVVGRFVTYGISLPPRLARYSEQIMALPSMQEWIAAAGKDLGG
jgi:glutathione S-transferase